MEPPFWGKQTVKMSLMLIFLITGLSSVLLSIASKHSASSVIREAGKSVPKNERSPAPKRERSPVPNRERRPVPNRERSPAVVPPVAQRKEICVDRNVIAPQGLGDIVLRLRPAIVIGEILGATITSPRVETYHGYSTTDMLGLLPCNPEPVSRNCILTTEFDAYALDQAVERYCAKGHPKHKQEWDSFVSRVRKFENCSNLHLSHKADYKVTLTRCFTESTRRMLRLPESKLPKRKRSVLFHRRGGDVEKGIGVPGDIWSPDDVTYKKALSSIKAHCNHVSVTMVTQTQNVSKLASYYNISGMKIQNGGNITDVLSLASEFDVVLVGGGGFSALIVQAARPKLVIHYAKHGYDYDEWIHARLGNTDLNSSTLAAICAE